MIERNLASRILESARVWPVVTVTGPRRSGKTTLCRAAFPDYSYVNLEDPAARDYAARDGRGFLNGLGVDLLIELGVDLTAIEIKSSETIGSHSIRGLNRLQKRVDAAGGPGRLRKFLVYAGAEAQRRSAATVVPWRDVATTGWR